MRLILLLGILLGKSHLFAQKITFVNIQKFNDRNGLSSPNPRKIIQDKFGFFWIGTQDGLNRFDGNTFLIYNTGAGSEKLKTPGNDFTDITEDTLNSTIWTVNSNGGICRIDLIAASVTYKYNLGIAALNCNPVNIICTDKYIVAVTNSSFIYFKNKQQSENFKQIDLGEELPLNTSIQKAVHIYRNTILLFLTNGTSILYDFDENLAKELVSINIPWSSKVKVTSVIKYKDNIYVATTEGLFKLSYTNTGLTTSQIIIAGNIISITVNNKYLLYNTSKKVFCQNLNTKEVNELAYSGMSDNTNYFKNIYALCVSENSLLMGGSSNLCLINKLNNPFAKFYNGIKPNTPPLKHVSYIDSKNDSIVRFCDGEGIGEINIKTSDIKWYAREQSYISFFNLNSDELLVSGENFNKIINTQNKQVRELPASLAFLKGDFIISVYRAVDSTIYFATYKSRKLYKLKITGQHSFKINELAVPDSSILNVNNIISYQGLIYFVCVRNIVTYNPESNTFKNNKIRCPGFPEGVEILMDLCKEQDFFYLAVYGYGIVKTDLNFKFIKNLTENGNVASNGFYKIFNVKDNWIFASSNNGLIALNMSNEKVLNFTENDGLHGNSFEESSGCFYNGNLAFGGINGITKIDVTSFKESIPLQPLLYLNSINFRSENESWEKRNFLIKDFSVPNNVTNVVLSLIPINYENPLEYFIEYRVKEISENWINNGKNDNIQLLGLSPGIYNVEIRAKTDKGISSAVLSLKIQFLPKWYQTWWFKFLVILVTGSIIYAFYRYRIRQIKKQHEIRKNIATDLHDDLGSTLNSVKVFTNLAISGVKQEESLQQVKDNLTEATMSLRDMIWVLDDSLDTVDELVTRLKQFAFPITAASNMEFVISAGSDVNSRTLTKEEKRNLFLICKEAINNSIKYSGATQITVAIIPAGKKIQITVADNGKGFDDATVKKGYGLKNMQYRAGQVKYSVSIKSSVGKGTNIIIAGV